MNGILCNGENLGLLFLGLPNRYRLFSLSHLLTVNKPWPTAVQSFIYFVKRPTDMFE